MGKKILLETGLRNIRELSKRYDKAKIYFHQDLDGVTTALAMKKYLEDNGINVVDAEVIQYGDREFAIKKPMARGDIMPVLVDFAHGKPMFVIHTDHHDKQVGAEKQASKSFRQARSNVETISQIISTSDIFPSEDITMISTVDSADFVKHGINPEDIMSYVFTTKKPIGDTKNFLNRFWDWFTKKMLKNPQKKQFSVSDNKKALALVTNKLLLAYKNKPQFLERLVMESKPSLINIYLNIVRIAKEQGYATPEEMKANLEKYIESQKDTKNVKYLDDYGIIAQYGGGALFKPGAYDRYVPFKNYPDANFLVIVWPLGLMQASCNPFKKERSLKGVNLGEIAQEMLKSFEGVLKEKTITVDTIKYFAEKHKSFGPESVGFNYTDMLAMFDDTDDGIKGLSEPPKGAPEDYTAERWRGAIKKIMEKPYNSLTDREKRALKKVSVTGWDMIQANSGGHKCITNVSGLMYFGSEAVPYLKDFAREFIKILKNKIDTSS
jgi:hypothetical protein